MKAIVVTDRAAGAAAMKLVERPEPQPSINDVVVQVYALYLSVVVEIVLGR
jgi:NADPH:quinone reductase-like Zn-dependent oxidoreductase